MERDKEKDVQRRKGKMTEEKERINREEKDRDTEKASD